MGMSTTAAFGIIFTASLFMMGALINSLLYSYYNINEALEDRGEMLKGAKEIMEIDRVVYNSSNIEIVVWNRGSTSLDVEKISMILNGTIVDFTTAGNFWYPQTKKRFFVASDYDVGEEHSIQFTLSPGEDVIATAEFDKIYVLTTSHLYAYSYEGVKIWSIEVNEPKDICVDTFVFIANASEIFEYDKDGNYVRSIADDLNITAIDAYNGMLYGVSNTTFYLLDYQGNLIKSYVLTQGKDVCVGKYVYVLDGSNIDKYDYQGNYISSILDARISNPLKISTDLNLPDTLFILNNGNEILLYRHGTYWKSISLEIEATNIDIYGKIYLSGDGVKAMNIGLRVKIVDEYGNSVYGYL